MEKGILKRMLIGTGLVFVAAISLPGYGSATETNTAVTDNDAILLLESVKQNYLASQRLEALKTKNGIPGQMQATNSSAMWLKRVNASEVNMVTNRYVADAQSKINMSGKVYYASGEAYTRTMQENPSLRFAKDPYTNKIVDKADAVIYADASGRALYFESNDTYKNFIALADQATTYGYSKPE